MAGPSARSLAVRLRALSGGARRRTDAGRVPLPRRGRVPRRRAGAVGEPANAPPLPVTTLFKDSGDDEAGAPEPVVDEKEDVKVTEPASAAEAAAAKEAEAVGAQREAAKAAAASAEAAAAALVKFKSTLAMVPPEPLAGVERDITGLTIQELTSSDAIYTHELSWLSFNWRVLAQALTPATPVFERLRFLAITGRNLDEFFAKRIGALKRQEAAGVANLLTKRSPYAWTPSRQLVFIAQGVQAQVRQQISTLVDEVLPELEKVGVQVFEYDDLEAAEQEALRAWFAEQLEPLLTPLAVDQGHPFPYIASLALSLAVSLHDPFDDDNLSERFAVVSVPSNLPRFLNLRKMTGEAGVAAGRGLNTFVPIEQVIRANLDSLFGGMNVEEVHPFRVTRNADVERNEDEAEDLLEMMTDEVRNRRFAPFVRLEVNDSMPDRMVARLQAELELSETDVYRSGEVPLGVGEYDSIEADFGLDIALEYEHWVPQPHPRLLKAAKNPSSIFKTIRSGDVLSEHPYHSFAATTQQFVETAAADPKVVAIKATLYRTSRDSPIISALIEAADRGKNVAVLVELKARFDEARNVGFAQRLEKAGVNVAYGLVGLKTHCKTTLVVRNENDGLRNYCHIGTGNYNPRTASVYTDYSLLTCDPEVGRDVQDLFKYLTGYHRQQDYRTVLVAPNAMRKQFIQLIDQEISNAKAGKPARITAKVNGLDDKNICSKLYEASAAGVTVELVVRGICRVRAGVPGISENIRIVSIIGRFLEHHRVFRFENGGDAKYFIGSADWMARNLVRRVELAVPLKDPKLQQQAQAMLDACLCDQVNAWEMTPTGEYVKPAPGASLYKPLSDSSFVNRARKEGLHAASMRLTKSDVKAARKKALENDRPNIKVQDKTGAA